jgi:hypothetical protein
MSQGSNAVSLSGCNPKPQKIPSTQFQPRDNRIQIDGLTISVNSDEYAEIVYYLIIRRFRARAVVLPRPV